MEIEIGSAVLDCFLNVRYTSSIHQTYQATQYTYRNQTQFRFSLKRTKVVASSSTPQIFTGADVVVVVVGFRVGRPEGGILTTVGAPVGSKREGIIVMVGVGVGKGNEGTSVGTGGDGAHVPTMGELVFKDVDRDVGGNVKASVSSTLSLTLVVLGANVCTTGPTGPSVRKVFCSFPTALRFVDDAFSCKANAAPTATPTAATKMSKMIHNKRDRRNPKIFVSE